MSYVHHRVCAGFNKSNLSLFKTIMNRDAPKWKFLAEAEQNETLAEYRTRFFFSPPCRPILLFFSLFTYSLSPIKRLRGFVVGCNNEYNNRHLLPTSELLKTQKINLTFIFERNEIIPDLNLNASMFDRIIRDLALSTEEVSISVYMNLCKSPFLIMC